MRERTLGTSALETVDTLRQLSAPVRRLGRLEETGALLDEALRRAQRLPRNQDGAVATAAVLNSRALLALARNDDELARREFRATLDAIAPFVAPDDFRIGRTLFSLARAEFALGSREEALLHARKAHEILRLRKGEAARSTQDASKLVDEIESAR
jgi:tetratricopeptide (TPR) repeat protein